MLSPESPIFLQSCAAELEPRTEGVIPTGQYPLFSGVEEGVMGVYSYSLDLVEAGYRPQLEPPLLDITRMTIRLAEREDGISAARDFDGGDIFEEERSELILNRLACLEAEPRLAHSLAKQGRGERERNPACILFDTAEQPFAYQKGSGQPLAFTWRDGYLATDFGPVWIPGGAVIWAAYRDGHDPRSVYAGESLLATPDGKVEQAYFLRFMNAQWLPRGLSLQAVEVGSQRLGERIPEAEVAEAAILSATRLQQRVAPCLDSARFV